MGFSEFAKTAVKNLFSSPATRDYPRYKKEFVAGARGHVIFDETDCIYCGLCMRKCPADAISVKRAEKTWSIVRAQCVQCASCVEACPKNCLSMGPEYTPVMTEKGTEVHARVPDHEEDHSDS